jgi:Ca2+-binding RTX toxin-like protein
MPATDTISSVGGADSIFGADDDDSLTGGTGADILTGGAGNDIMLGQGDNDRFDDGGTDAGNDSISGGAGDDVAVAGAGVDTIHLESGNDLITANRTLSDTDTDEYSGGGGEDELDLSHGDTMAGASLSTASPTTRSTVAPTMSSAIRAIDADAGPTTSMRRCSASTSRSSATTVTIPSRADRRRIISKAQPATIHCRWRCRRCPPRLDGNDILIGAAGPDAITGGNGDDSITANDGVAD